MNIGFPGLGCGCCLELFGSQVFDGDVKLLLVSSQDLAGDVKLLLVISQELTWYVKLLLVSTKDSAVDVVMNYWVPRTWLEKSTFIS